MVKYLIPFFLCVFSLSAQSAGSVLVVPASASSTVIATATTVTCQLTANPAKTIVTVNCSKSGTAIGATALNVVLSGEVVTWSLFLSSTDQIAGTFTQAVTVGTLAYSIAVNGGTTPTTGNF